MRKHKSPPKKPIVNGGGGIIYPHQKPSFSDLLQQFYGANFVKALEGGPLNDATDFLRIVIHIL